MQHPSQVLRVGQEVDVRVVGVDRENKKIALSLKQVEENPWTRIEQKYHVGDTVPAKITKLAQFGAFAELEPGSRAWCTSPSCRTSASPIRSRSCAKAKTSACGSSRSIRHGIGLDLRSRQAEDAGEYDYGGGYEAWTGGTSYAFSGSSLDGDRRSHESKSQAEEQPLWHELSQPKPKRASPPLTAPRRPRTLRTLAAPSPSDLTVLG